jgi:hypothetical protein
MVPAGRSKPVERSKPVPSRQQESAPQDTGPIVLGSSWLEINHKTCAEHKFSNTGKSKILCTCAFPLVVVTSVMIDTRKDQRAVLALASVIITVALAYLFSQGKTYVHIDAIAHVNKARGIWDNSAPGLLQLGSIWLPLPHVLIAPLTRIDTLWTTGLAGSILSVACFIGAALFLYRSASLWTCSRAAGWLAFFFFALNPRLIYLFTTPMTEPLMVFCAAGLIYYLLHWIETESVHSFAMASLMMFAGTLTRYEGWAIALAAIPLVFIVARHRRFTAATLFAGAAALGPLLWMIYNWVYFEDPLFFTYGHGSAREYAENYFLRTGKLFPTAGHIVDSIWIYFADVAYCVNPFVVWFGVGGACFAWLMWRHGQWRKTLAVLTLAAGPFVFYVYNLYANVVPVMIPGISKDSGDAIYNIRYGTIMAATLPVLAGYALLLVFRRSEHRRPFALALLGVLFLPNPIPEASEEGPADQLTRNLFFMESEHNQSFWMPPFVEVAHRLQTDMDSVHDGSSCVLANSRIVHPVVWVTGIPMKRFVHELNRDRWDSDLNTIDSGIRWVITEEGDQLWNAQGKLLKHDWDEVAFARTPYTGIVHLYRRR